MCIRLKVSYKMSTVSVRSFYAFFLFVYPKTSCISESLTEAKKVNKIQMRKSHL